MARILSLLIVVWLIIGVVAAFQRNYFSDARTNCAEASGIVLTIAAGPLNYMGLNPKIACKKANVPKPSR